MRVLRIDELIELYEYAYEKLMLGLAGGVDVNTLALLSVDLFYTLWRATRQFIDGLNDETLKAEFEKFVLEHVDKVKRGELDVLGHFVVMIERLKELKACGIDTDRFMGWSPN